MQSVQWSSCSSVVFEEVNLIGPWSAYEWIQSRSTQINALDTTKLTFFANRQATHLSSEGVGKFVIVVSIVFLGGGLGVQSVRVGFEVLGNERRVVTGSKQVVKRQIVSISWLRFEGVQLTLPKPKQEEQSSSVFTASIATLHELVHDLLDLALQGEIELALLLVEITLDDIDVLLRKFDECFAVDHVGFLATQHDGFQHNLK